MKRTFLTVSVLFCCLPLLPQSLAPTLLSTSGGQAQSPSFILSWSVGEPAVETFTNSQFILTEGFQQPFGPYRMSGEMAYLNAASTPMSNSVAYLKTLTGNIADSALTTNNGDFYFFHATAGQYITGGKTNKEWGGANATDALLILKHFVHLSLLYGMYKDAGDVNLTGNLNSLDALLVARRFVGTIASFPMSDWLFSKDTVAIAATPQNITLNALCAGDVNGTHLPAAKTEPSISMVRKGSVYHQEGKSLKIPLKTEADLTVAAISLVMDLPGDLSAVTNVTLNSGEGNLVWNLDDSHLRIAWYSMKPCSFPAGSTLLTLLVNSPALTEKAPVLPLPLIGSESEFASFEGIALPEARLSFPSIIGESGTGDLLIECCSPNPTKGTTTLYYHMNISGTVTIGIYDLPGKLLEEYTVDQPMPGTYQQRLFLDKYNPGTYLVKHSVTTQFGSRSSISKILLVK
jgi:hypothetical protein